VIVEAAVLIVGKKDYGVLPVRTVANCVNYPGDVGLASLNIRWRMLVVFQGRSGQAKIWIDKRDRGQQSQCGFDKKSGKGQEVRIKVRRAEKTEARSLRGVLKIIGPGNAVFIEQVEDRAGNRLIARASKRRETCRPLSGARRKWPPSDTTG